MGFETFRVELHGGPATHAQVEDVVRSLPHAQPDGDTIALPGSAYYTIEDGWHVIEVEVADSPVRVSCRFTLCHPPSVDSVFLDLVRKLQVRLGMESRICDDVRPGENLSFPCERFSEFASAVLSSIARKRAEWIAQFSDEPLAATTPEVYEKIILPRCDPIPG